MKLTARQKKILVIRIVKGVMAVQVNRARLKLLPCPCCGGKAGWNNGARIYDFRVAVECTRCGLRTGPIPYSRTSDKQAARTWNRRAKKQPPKTGKTGKGR